MPVLWKNWPGRSVFHCGGRLISGNNPNSFILAFTLLVLVSILFFTTTCGWLIYRWPLYGSLITAGGLALFLVTASAMLRTAFTDAGVLPRYTDPTGGDPWTTVPQALTRTIKSVEVKSNWCRTCKLFKPPRTAHCGECNNCV